MSDDRVRQAFQSIGADVLVTSSRVTFEIDVAQHAGRELFELRYPPFDALTTEVVNVDASHRHLVLEVTNQRRLESECFLCGHDESHWFVASLPVDRPTETVRKAMEALKPQTVLREQKRKRVKQGRFSRATAAYVRQGEWFFLPRPNMHVQERLIVPDGTLTRDGGKPHRVQWLYRSEEDGLTFAGGDVSHPDHSTIHLGVWHRVVQNNERQPGLVKRPVARVTYLD